MNKELRNDLGLLLVVIMLATSSLINAWATSGLRKRVLALELEQTEALANTAGQNRLNNANARILKTIIDTINHIHNGGEKIVGTTDETETKD